MCLWGGNIRSDRPEGTYGDQPPWTKTFLGRAILRAKTGTVQAKPGGAGHSM